MTEDELKLRARARLRVQQGRSQQPIVPTTEPESVDQTLAKDIESDPWTAAQSGIARSAMKTVRGLGTTLLPKVAEQWAEKEGFLPTQKDIELLEAGGRDSNVAGATTAVADVLTALVPAGQVSKATAGKNLLTKALAGAATGAAQEGVLAEEGKVADAMKSGAMWGAGGELAPAILGHTASRIMPSTQATKDLMARGVSPTLGQGADPSTWRGTVTKGLEDVLQVSPISGAPLRAAKDKAARQVFEEAARIVDPNVVPGAIQQTVDALRQSTSSMYRAPLDTVRVPVLRAGTELSNELAAQAKAFQLSPRIQARIDAEISDSLSGATGRSAPARMLENMASELTASVGSGAEAEVRKAMAKKLRSMVNAATEAGGIPIAPARQARASFHVLDRATPGGARPAPGISGERLASAVRANDARMGAQLTPELATLAEQASGVAPAARAYGIGNPSQAVGTFAELLGLGGTSGLANLGLLGYGGMQHTALPKLLLGDPTTRDAFISALRNPAYRAVGLGLDEE